MDIKTLRQVLGRIAGTLGAGDAAEAKSAVEQLDSALSDRDGETVEQLARNLGAGSPADFVNLLNEAARSEAEFMIIMRRMRDAKLKKQQLQVIVKAYVGRVDTKASVTELYDRMKLHFYEQVYEDSARKLAERATPW